MTILTRVKTGLIGRYLRRIVQLQRVRGSRRTVYAVLRRLAALRVLRPWVHLCAVDVWRLSSSGTSGPSRASALFSVRWATRDDADRLIDYFGGAARVTTRLAKGNRCVVTLCGDTIGAAVWLAMGPGEYAEDWDDLRCIVRFPQGVAWSYDGKGTRMGAWGAMMKKLPELLVEEGIEQSNAIIDGDNWPSIDGHRSLGYESLGVLLHLRILGMGWRAFRPHGAAWQRVPRTIDRLEIITR